MKKLLLSVVAIVGFGGIAAAAAVAVKRATSPGCTGGKALPAHPVTVALHRGLPLRPVTVALRLVAEASSRRVTTYSRTLR